VTSNALVNDYFGCLSIPLLLETEVAKVFLRKLET